MLFVVQNDDDLALVVKLGIANSIPNPIPMGRGYTLFQEESIPTGIDSEIWNQFRNSNLFKNTPSEHSLAR